MNEFTMSRYASEKDLYAAMHAEIGRLRAELSARSTPKQGEALSDERIDHIADIVARGMPDGISGFCKSWGYRQFARALLEDCAGHYAAPPQQVEPGWRPISTAPKDGTEIVGCTWLPELPHLYSPRRIFWAAYHPNSSGEVCWRDAPTCGNKMNRLTHYAPLLAAPKEHMP